MGRNLQSTFLLRRIGYILRYTCGGKIKGCEREKHPF
jgi:hypothetical protein